MGFLRRSPEQVRPQTIYQEEQPSLYSSEELIQQSPQPPQSSQYDRIVQENKVANFISQTSPYRSVEKIDYILRGYSYDLSRNTWIKVSDGIPDIIRLSYLKTLTPHLTEDVRMGRLDMKTINNIMAFLIEWSIDYLDIVADTWNLTEEDMSNIHYVVCSAVFYTLSRSLNGMERDKIYATLKLGDDFSAYGKQEEKKGIFSNILPWK